MCCVCVVTVMLACTCVPTHDQMPWVRRHQQHSSMVHFMSCILWPPLPVKTTAADHTVSLPCSCTLVFFKRLLLALDCTVTLAGHMGTAYNRGCGPPLAEAAHRGLALWEPLHTACFHPMFLYIRPGGALHDLKDPTFARTGPPFCCPTDQFTPSSVLCLRQFYASTCVPSPHHSNPGAWVLPLHVSRVWAAACVLPLHALCWLLGGSLLVALACVGG